MLILFVAALAASPSSGLGAVYPGAVAETVPGGQRCYSRYRFSTGAGIAQVASFYRVEAEGAGVPLFDDTNAKFADYRTLLFMAEPKFMFVVLDRKDGQTMARVVFKTGGGPACR